MKPPRKIVVRKRNGLWVVEPNDVGDCKVTMVWDTFDKALGDITMICHSEQIVHNNRKQEIQA